MNVLTRPKPQYPSDRTAAHNFRSNVYEHTCHVERCWRKLIPANILSCVELVGYGHLAQCHYDCYQF